MNIDDLAKLQQAASNPLNNVWVTANAGTGKTKVLIDRILRLLLKGTSPEQILCITYTKAAIREIENRIVSSLSRWSYIPEDSLTQELTSLLGSSLAGDKAQLAATLHTARSLCHEVLSTPSGVKVLTIHSFCQAFIKKFFLEARVNSNFKILNEEPLLLQELNEQLFSHIATDITSPAPKIESSILEYFTPTSLKLFLEDEVPRYSHQLIELMEPTAAKDSPQSRLSFEKKQSQAKFSAPKEQQNIQEKILAYVYSWVKNGAHPEGPDPSKPPSVTSPESSHSLKTTEAHSKKTLQILNKNQAALEVAAAKLSEAAREISFKATDAKFLAALQNWLAHLSKGEELPLSVWYFTFHTKTYTPRKTLLTKSGWALLSLQEKELFQEEASTIAHLYEAQLTQELCHKCAHILTFGIYTAQLYAEAKTEALVLDYNDLIRLTLGMLINKMGFMPWVNYSVNAQVSHLLIDEAQDASPEQWGLILALVDNIFSSEQTLTPGEKTVFVVGDLKQSIYSFQGAYPAYLATVKQKIKESLSSHGLELTHLTFSTSFRSGPAIIQYVNQAVPILFEQQKEPLELTGLTHQCLPRDLPGKVELYIITPPEETPSKEPPKELSLKGAATSVEAPKGSNLSPETPAPHPTESLYQEVVNHVEKLIKVQGYQAQDIMILQEKRSTGHGDLQKLSYMLQNKGIAVSGLDRYQLLDHIIVRDLLALAKYILQPYDDFNLACLLKSPIFNFSEQELASLLTASVSGSQGAAEAPPEEGATPTLTTGANQASYPQPSRGSLVAKLHAWASLTPSTTHAHSGFDSNGQIIIKARSALTYLGHVTAAATQQLSLPFLFYQLIFELPLPSKEEAFNNSVQPHSSAAHLEPSLPLRPTFGVNNRGAEATKPAPEPLTPQRGPMRSVVSPSNNEEAAAKTVATLYTKLLGQDAPNTLDEFLNQVINFEETQSVSSLYHFVHYLEKVSSEVKKETSQASNYVRLLTIHGAKGLESKVVFLLDSTKSSIERNLLQYNNAKKDNVTLWVRPTQNDFVTPPLADRLENQKAESAAEKQRLLYVALTRAKESLFIYTLPDSQFHSWLPNPK